MVDSLVSKSDPTTQSMVSPAPITKATSVPPVEGGEGVERANLIVQITRPSGFVTLIAQPPQPLLSDSKAAMDEITCMSTAKLETQFSIARTETKHHPLATERLGAHVTGPIHSLSFPKEFSGRSASVPLPRNSESKLQIFEDDILRNTFNVPIDKGNCLAQKPDSQSLPQKTLQIPHGYVYRPKLELIDVSAPIQEKGSPRPAGKKNIFNGRPVKQKQSRDVLDVRLVELTCFLLSNFDLAGFD
jgi:hypothetical protein